MNATISPSSLKPNQAPPLPTDLSERIWKLLRTITDPTVKRSRIKDAKRALLGALLVQNTLGNIPVRPISRKAARASSSSVRANRFNFPAPDQSLLSTMGTRS